MVTRNVAKLVDAPRVPRHEISPLTPEQARHLIDTAADDRHRGLYVTASGPVCARGSCWGSAGRMSTSMPGVSGSGTPLPTSRVTLTLLEPKTDRSRRMLVLPESVGAALRAHRTRQRMERLVAGSRWIDSGHVFTTTRGTPLHAGTVSAGAPGSARRAGLPHSRFQDLRHAAATFLLAQGFTLEDVKNMLGHSSIVLTSNTYGHVLEQRQQQVARGMDAVLSG